MDWFAFSQNILPIVANPSACIFDLFTVYNCMSTIVRPFETRESIRRKVDHGGQIVLWYWQHATNLARATVFVVCMSSARVLVWVRSRVEQKRSLTFCVFGQIRIILDQIVLLCISSSVAQFHIIFGF